MGLHSLLRKALPALLLVAVTAGHCQANDSIRRAQEELRRRNLFFGDVDGKPSPELTAAVRVYQSHKGFEPTGQLDQVTARSLDIETTHGSANEPAAKWPDVPVLKSDAARELPPQKQAEMEKAAVTNINASPTPEIPAEAPSGPQNLDPAIVTNFVKDYLRDNERNDLETQLKYYAYPVDYFTHGEVGEKFVARDNRNYMQRWPDRQYTLTAPVKFAAGPRGGETVVEFPIAFHVRNKTREVAGKTRNYWTIRPEDGALKIIAIREEHLHE
ncbi:MAG TPA: peptidoglycan-binding domain-containing protein [Chthoniobacterales bacterium]